MSNLLAFGPHTLDLSRPRVMGILNVTPDSFSDGGMFVGRAQALDHARRMAADGADIIDIGGESSRPGATPVREEVELERVIPLVEALAREGMRVSVDTVKPAVMRAALIAGAGMINDVRALREPGSMETVVESNAAVCLMHMHGEPRTMQAEPRYDDVVTDVCDFLVERARSCEAAGIARDRIVIDPGFGFGKTVAHNLALKATGYHVLAGISRKSMLGAIAGRNMNERAAASVAAALAMVARGVSIVRVHDVRETVDALNVWHAIETGSYETQILRH
jgi:dihydropteroate synthase